MAKEQKCILGACHVPHFSKGADFVNVKKQE